MACLYSRIEALDGTQSLYFFNQNLESGFHLSTSLICWCRNQSTGQLKQFIGQCSFDGHDCPDVVSAIDVPAEMVLSESCSLPECDLP